MSYGARYINPRTGKVEKGHLLVVQKMGTDPDGRIIAVLGKDGHAFNIEDGDQFWTAIFAVDPFEAVES